MLTPERNRAKMSPPLSDASDRGIQIEALASCRSPRKLTSSIGTPISGGATAMIVLSLAVNIDVLAENVASSAVVSLP